MSDNERDLPLDSEPMGEVRLGSGYAAGYKDIVSLAPPPDSAGLGTPVAIADGSIGSPGTSDDSTSNGQTGT